MQYSCYPSVRFFIYGLLLGLLLGAPLATRILPRLESAWASQPASFGAAEDNPLDQFNLSGLLIPREAILHGGPRKDGIPSLSKPKVIVAKDASFMKPEDRVIGVTINEERRAYPIRLLNYHEIVNDEVGGVPIAVIYCPLCDSVSVVDRRVNGNATTFGVSGLLHNSNVLLYDRKDDGLWSQLGMKAISGPNAGIALQHINTWQLTKFGQWMQQHPASTVLTFDTGHRRDYESSPYAAYCENEDLYFPVQHEDSRLTRKDRVIGIVVGDRTIAIPVDAIASGPAPQVDIAFGVNRLVLASSADTHEIRIIESPPGASVIHTFWFAWVAFNPETEVYIPPSPGQASSTAPQGTGDQP